MRPMKGRQVIALVTATDAELRPIRHRLKLGRVRRLRFAGDVAGKRIIAAVTGPGRLRATAMVERLLTQHGITRLVHFGYAGGLNPELHAGQLLRIGQLVSPEQRPIELVGLRPHTLLTVDHPIYTVEHKASAWASYDADAVDMESHAVAEVCDQSGVHYTAVRAISDPADTALPPGAMAMLHDDGRTDPVGVAMYLALNPLRIGALLRLSQDTGLAGRTLANEVERIVGTFEA
jgi:adenosylhomocysteine nucleosidase